MKTLQEFVTTHQITAKAERISSNPNMSDMPYGSRHFKVTLYRIGRQRLTVPFSQGSAHTDDPTALDVLNCLALDASGLENARSFEDWASEYGYDTDSRKAEKTFRAVERQTEKLKRFLDAKQYNELLYRTETL